MWFLESWFMKGFWHQFRILEHYGNKWNFLLLLCCCCFYIIYIFVYKLLEEPSVLYIFSFTWVSIFAKVQERHSRKAYTLFYNYHTSNFHLSMVVLKNIFLNRDSSGVLFELTVNNLKFAFLFWTFRLNESNQPNYSQTDDD